MAMSNGARKPHGLACAFLFGRSENAVACWLAGGRGGCRWQRAAQWVGDERERERERKSALKRCNKNWAPMNDDVHTILFATPSTSCVRWIYAKLSVINIECNKKNCTRILSGIIVK